ncbi:MAG: sensor domain-containing protein [Bifidobacteriaceae bacterium]|nr:sensor domain-containing protein [Bifidobacteriaceae bacterium]
MRLRRALGKWARRWVFTAAQLGLSMAAWVYVVLFAASMLLMILIVGLLTARTVLPLARVLANWSLRGAAWARGLGEPARIPATPAATSLGAVVTALLRSPETWRSVLYLLVNAVSLPVHAAALVLFPLAGQWGRADASLTVRLLAGTASQPLHDAARSASTVGSAQARTGFGLAGMIERVAALGGQLTAGPTGDGGFAVQATLPLSADQMDGHTGSPGDGHGDDRAKWHSDGQTDRRANDQADGQAADQEDPHTGDHGDRRANDQADGQVDGKQDEHADGKLDGHMDGKPDEQSDGKRE